MEISETPEVYQIYCIIMTSRNRTIKVEDICIKQEANQLKAKSFQSLNLDWKTDRKIKYAGIY